MLEEGLGVWLGVGDKWEGMGKGSRRGGKGLGEGWGGGSRIFGRDGEEVQLCEGRRGR